jgi:DNA processing protein
MELQELAAWLRLSAAPGIGDATARRLLAAFGLPQAVFDQEGAALRQVLSANQVQALRAEPDVAVQAAIARTWRWLNEPDATGAQRALVTLGDPRYPASLLRIEDPPLMLYVLGMPPPEGSDWFGDAQRHVAIVGSRNPTPQGLFNAREFAKSLAQAGHTVVSGLALGIDGAAHDGALEGAPADRLATLAVVGTGLDQVYPRRHAELAHRVARHGAIISEFALGTPALGANFPRRNRLIAGLSQATLVVEAALKSGSLVTARLASEQGREVLAIPGSIHAPQSRGCHALIKQGAKLVESAEDVLQELHAPGVPHQACAAAAMPPSQEDVLPRGEEDAALLARLGHDPVSLDGMVARTGLDTATLQARLLELELAGVVARLPGGLYQRLGSA